MLIVNALRLGLMLVLFSLALAVASIPWLMGSASAPRPLVPEGTEQDKIPGILNSFTAAERESMSKEQVDAYLSNPLNLEALQNLAVLRELDGKKTEAQAIALSLANFSRRSVTSQLSAIQIDFGAKDYASAFSRIDGVLRAQPDFIKEFIPTFTSLLQSEDARKQLALTLATFPPWRNQFFSDLNEADNNGTLTYRVLSDIRKANGTILDVEKQRLLLKLISARQFDQAYFIWLDLQTPEELLKVQNVFDPGFTQDPKNLGFGWNAPVRKSARVQAVGRPGQSTDRVMSLDFSGDRNGGPYLYQYIQLSPGRFILSFDAQVESIKNEQGLVWALRCLQTGAEIAKSSPIKDKGPWENRSLEFEVPAEQCGTQLLALENRSAASLDQEISGRLFFDNVSIKNLVDSQE
jgi:hypothetical protein